MGKKRSRHSSPGTVMLKMPEPVEFRAPSTDAWYDVRLVVDREAEVIHVLYCNFSEEFDETYSADAFSSAMELDDFKSRFRPASLQFQDTECGDLGVGAAVCASNDFGEDGLRFYDAIVESIEPSKGQPKGCKSVCTCAFTIIWQHGPLIGKLSTKNIQDICVWQPRCKQNEALNHFLEIAMKKIGTRNLSADIDLGRKSYGATASTEVRVISSSDDTPTVNFDAATTSSQGQYHIIKIENMEKDISATAIINFLHEQTSIWSLMEFTSSFLPNRCSGKIFVRSEEHADKLLDFLLNPMCIVISTRGNPWVIKEDWIQKSEGPSFICEKCAKVQQDKSKLRLVYKNSREYERAQKLQKICYEFIERVKDLSQRLEADEKTILQSRG